MGLDKRKPILLKDEFVRDPLYPKNAQLSIENNTILPNLEDDAKLDKRQSVYYSFEYVLKKLLDNDRFIDEYLRKTRTQLDYVSKSRLDEAVNQIGVDTTASLSVYKNYLTDHENEYHKPAPNYNLHNVAEDYLRSDTTNFDAALARTNFQECQPETYLSATKETKLLNDFVINVEFSENVRRPTNFVNASVCNKTTDGLFRQSMDFNIDIMAQIPSLTSTTYIYKEWLSGMKELYIHVPTTLTMYNENKNAASQDYWRSEKVNENITLLQIKINRRHFKWNHIYQAYICGQSLPLQIHNESNYKYFSDVILPSMLKTLCVQPIDQNNSVNCIYDENTSMYVLYFVCYGTDEQAIRIIGD